MFMRLLSSSSRSRSFSNCSRYISRSWRRLFHTSSSFRRPRSTATNSDASLRLCVGEVGGTAWGRIGGDAGVSSAGGRVVLGPADGGIRDGSIRTEK